MTRKSEGIAGILPVLKQPGPTSHDVVQVARRVLHQRQIGHTGTLDPAAGGLLVLCLGPYTKLVPYLVDSDKVYRGLIALGIETSTDDSEGKPTLAGDASGVTRDSLCAAASRYTGEIEQIPPAYSAVKVAGRKLYEYARKNQEVVIQPRRVTVHRLDLGAPEPMEAPREMIERAQASSVGDLMAEHARDLRKVTFEARVSAGTYVRSLARDLGRDLGCGGYLLSLWRSSVGPFDDTRAIAMEELQSDPGRAEEFMLRGAAAVDATRFPVLKLIRGFQERFFNGHPLNEKMMENATVAGAVPSGVVCAVTGDDGALLGMVEAERFDSQRHANPYDSRFDVHLRPLRVFPGGLR